MTLREHLKRLVEREQAKGPWRPLAISVAVVVISLRARDWFGLSNTVLLMMWLGFLTAVVALTISVLAWKTWRDQPK